MYFAFLAGERAVAERQAGVVHDDARFRTGAREVNQVGVLMMVDERVEGQTHADSEF